MEPSAIRTEETAQFKPLHRAGAINYIPGSRIITREQNGAIWTKWRGKVSDFINCLGLVILHCVVCDDNHI